MKTSFVIARYKEDLSWLRQLQGDIDINIFTKSTEPLDFDHGFKANITFMPNRGRESGTYLHFLSRVYVPGVADYLVFTQGDPFEHSPDFIRIVNSHKSSWLPVQCLSLQWIEKKMIPPPALIASENSEWFSPQSRLRTELFSLNTWAPLQFCDRGSLANGDTYLTEFGLPPGSNIASDFLSRCGLSELSASAKEAVAGMFSYGAIFAVSDSLVNTFVSKHREQLVAMEKLANQGHWINGYMFERLWLHLFGMPFLKAI